MQVPGLVSIEYTIWNFIVISLNNKDSYRKIYDNSGFLYYLRQFYYLLYELRPAYLYVNQSAYA